MPVLQSPHGLVMPCQHFHKVYVTFSTIKKDLSGMLCVAPTCSSIHHEQDCAAKQLVPLVSVMLQYVVKLFQLLNPEWTSLISLDRFVTCGGSPAATSLEQRFTFHNSHGVPDKRNGL